MLADERAAMGATAPRELRVPLVPPDDWIADHRQRLHQVMNHWVPMLLSA
ncbi:hypothetical protein ACIP9H_36635 [Streptomyces sp. NPDC088732]